MLRSFGAAAHSSMADSLSLFKVPIYSPPKIRVPGCVKWYTEL